MTLTDGNTERAQNVDGASDRVFVVHGRNLEARDAMFTFLRSLGLKPLEWSQAVTLTGNASPYIGEVLDKAFDYAQAIVVLMTPDDIAYIDRPYADGDNDPELTPTPQARPNVLFEAGMAMGRSPTRTILVELGAIRPFSDVAGRHAVRLNNSPEKRIDLANRLEGSGCPVDRSGTDWMSSGNFIPPDTSNGLVRARKVASNDRRGAHVDAKWHSQGSNRFDELKVTNNGAVPLFNVTFEFPDDIEGITLYQDNPLKRLPPGKSFTIKGDAGNKTMGGNRPPEQFDIIVLADLEDGTKFREEVFIDVNG
jgi:predicted nucleotide-binding protein